MCISWLLMIMLLSMHGSTMKLKSEIYLLIKYIKSVLWRVAKCLSLYRGSAVPKVEFRVRSGFYKHPSAGPFGDRLYVLHN